MNDAFNQHKEDLKTHLLQGYGRDLSLRDFYSWTDETYSMCKNLVKVMKNNMKNYRNNNEELERIFKEYWNIREIRKFMKEVHPLKIFLNSTYGDFPVDSIFLTNGNENYDAILKKGNQEIFVEITGTQDGEFILNLLLYTYQFSCPAPFMRVTTQELHDAIRDNKPVNVNVRHEEQEKSLKKEAEEVSKAIRRKSEKNYQEGTLLIVSAFSNQSTPSCSLSMYYKLPQDAFRRLKKLNIEPSSKSPWGPIYSGGNEIESINIPLTPWNFFHVSMEEFPEKARKFNGIYIVGLFDKHCKALEFDKLFMQ